MISISVKNKLLHDLKRAAKVLGYILEESDHQKRQDFLSLLRDEYDRLAEDIQELPVNEEKERTNELPTM